MSVTNVNNSSGEITQINNNFNKLNLIESQTSIDILRLGHCYEYGIGVEKDENKAFIHYQKSARMNNPNGIYQVGYCYYLGIGVEVDKHKAFMYYLESAEAGNSMGIWKTAICYGYGIGVKKSKDKYHYWTKNDPIILFYDEFDDLIFPDRYSEYGKCAYCNEYNTRRAWCQTCDPDITIREWTSGNKDIDDCMRRFQLRTDAYELMIEWIPFDRLNNIKKIGEGGFGSVFSATWLDGIRKTKTIKKDDDYFHVRTREQSSTVALKTLSGSIENPLDFLKEFDNHLKCKFYGSNLKIYGLTHNTEKNEYLMVFQYADNGSLYKFLQKNFQELTWKTKIKLLVDISGDLKEIHRAGYIHADFHSGNILQHRGSSKRIRSYISDLGLSKKRDENDSEGRVIGVVPYVAPEVLSGRKYTTNSDVYGLGVIMSEVSTGQRPFDGYEFDQLSFKIQFGLRPEFAPGTPYCYIELARQCMDSDPEKRPTALDVYQKFDKWNEIMEDSDDTDEIKKQFLDADKVVKELPVISPKHSDFMYTSKSINTQITSEIKDLLSFPIDSLEIPID